MSKLLELLERISAGRAQPLGFEAAVTRAKSSPMLLVASVPVGNAKLATMAVKEGADALVLTLEHLKKDKEALALISDAKADIPWGVSLETVTKEEIEQLVEMKCDFAVFTPDKTPAAVLGEERIGKVLQLRSSLNDNLAKSIARLPIDAVLLSPASEDESPLTVHQLMVYERLASGVGKHLLAAMRPGPPSEDLETLWSLGVRGIVVNMTEKDIKQSLSQLKEAIQKLPTTRKRAEEKISAVLPPYTEQSTAPPPEEEDEDDI